jgi:hypothetical protein
MARLQVTGFVTIANSSKLTDEQKQAVLEASEGKVRAVRAKLVDADGNETSVQAILGLSKKGSLSGRFAMKIDAFDLVEVDDPKAQKADSDKEKAVDDLAAELLG